MSKRLVPAILFMVFLIFSGCRNFFVEEPSASSGTGEGILQVSLSGEGVSSTLSARTILPQTPEFTRYELRFDASAGLESLEFYESAAQFHLTTGSYTVQVIGWAGSVPIAQSAPESITISSGSLTTKNFVLGPFTGGNGVLNYTLGWDGATQMPAKAELLIETFATDPPTPISISSFPSELSVGSAPGTILLLDKATGLVKLSGSLSLPDGQYRLTMTVTMDGAFTGVSRMDIAHIYTNLTSSGLFFYGSGDLISTIGLPSGTTFITGFNFERWPNATSVIGGVADSDGNRLIMVIVPTDADPANLKPVVETAPGVVISSPTPIGSSFTDLIAPDSPVDTFPPGDYSRPTSWTAVDKNGNTQQYTLVVNKAPAAGCQITDFFFKEYPYAAVALNEDAGTIDVQVPYGAGNLTPVISILGKDVVEVVSGSEQAIPTSPSVFIGSPRTFRVHAQDAGTPKDYVVTVTAAKDNEAEITRFAIDGYPDIQVTVTTPGGSVSGTVWPDGAIIGQMPYGVSLSNLKPLIQFKGDRIEPASELSRNFNGTVSYKVIAQDGSTRTYRVTLTNKPGNTDTGIFNFVITNVSNAKVVIGQNPRSGDGRIPIVIQVPYGTNETNLIPEITLTNSSSTVNPASRARIPFGNGGNNQEAVYRVTAQVPSVFQEYVVVVSEDIQYYYVNGLTGRDDWPDIYNGGSESYPFKTLAYAVHKASQYPTINKVFVNGELNNTTEGGAWENASEGASGFHPSGGTGSVFNLIGTNKPITISGISNATLRGIAGKRVISLTGSADITFENITITGGNTQENGGGIFISGSSKIKFSGGSIIGNTGANGGGVYVNDDTSDGDYDFTLVNGSVTGNTATASSASTPIAGGGGIYTNNYALVWLAGGTVSNNTTAGSGGGILINGQAENIGGRRGDEYGLLMSGGAVSNNRSNGGSSPHGGGGVYVAKGVFEMLAGQVNGNNSVRQGGGVFVWHNARFSASGTSSITNNEGVGSSKAICSRGYTEMMGKAQADKIYIWNNNPVAEGSFANEPDTFTLAENARAVGIVLAYDDTSPGPQTRNFINILAAVPGTDPICSIDLEGHLTNYQFKDTNLNDWIGKTVLKVSTGLGASQTSDLLARFPLNTFVGGSTVSLAPYKLERETSGSISVILKKK